MNIYFDTALLLKSYVFEPDSEAVFELIRKYGAPICFTGFQRIEIHNALHRKCARSELTRKELARALERIRQDAENGVLASPALDWNAAFEEADRLTAAFAIDTQCRTLDVLHIASAIGLGLGKFGTTDIRQAMLAQKAGLEIVAP